MLHAQLADHSARVLRAVGERSYGEKDGKEKDKRGVQINGGYSGIWRMRPKESADVDREKKRELRSGRRIDGEEDISSRSERGDWRERQSGHRWKKNGRGSDLTLEEIRRAVEEIDQETFVREEMCLEVREAELEARKKCEKMVTEELAEITAKTPVEQVWESFEKVREKWESDQGGG